jgi:hypothetical protein
MIGMNRNSAPGGGGYLKAREGGHDVLPLGSVCVHSGHIGMRLATLGLATGTPNHHEAKGTRSLAAYPSPEGCGAALPSPRALLGTPTAIIETQEPAQRRSWLYRFFFGP